MDCDATYLIRLDSPADGIRYSISVVELGIDMVDVKYLRK